MNPKRVSKSALTKLRTAVEEINKGYVLSILQSHDVNLQDVGNNGDTFLHSVLENAKTQKPKCSKIIEILTILLDRGLNVNLKNKKEETVLHLAVAHRLKEIIDFLIERNADINVISSRGNSIAHYLMTDELYKFRNIPLHNTSSGKLLWLERRSADFIDYLVSRGFNFDCKNNLGESPAHLAIKYNLQHILLTLLKHTIDINYLDKKNRTLLHAYLRVNAWTKDYTKRPMLTHNFNKGRYVLNIITTLLDKGVSIDVADKDEVTALQYAFQERDMKIVQLLVDRAVENDDKYLTKFLHFIIEDEYSSQFKPNEPAEKDEYIKILNAVLLTLVSKTTKFHNEPILGSTIIQLAVLKSRLDVLRLLSGNETGFNVLTSDGKNLLHLISEDPDAELRKLSFEEYEEMVEILVNRGCDVNATNDMRRSPLHEAAANGKYPVMKKLIKYGADVNLRKDVLMWTPLHLAADNDQPTEVARLLISHGAKINLRDTCGRTPLHLTLENSGRLTKLLLMSGAQADVQDKRKRTPLVTAISRKHLKEVVELLKYGANFNDSFPIPRYFPRYFPQLDDDPIERRPLLDSILQRHWIKLRVAGLPHPIEYQSRVEHKKFQNFNADCHEEVKRLKTRFIDERVSFFSFLHMDPNRRCAYSSNQKLQNVINYLLSNEFPIYSTLILASYHEALARKPLLEPAKLGWIALTNIILPDICVDRIISYLSNASLLNLIEEELTEN